MNTTIEKVKTATPTKKLSTVETVMKANPGVFKRIEDIVIPEILFHPMTTGTPEFDRSFSELGGITPGSVYLTTGEPGAGKTTLLATLASRLQTPKPVVFLSYEMSDFQLKLAAKKIPGMDGLLIVTENYHKTREELLKFLATLKDLDPALIIVDSLQKMAGGMKGSFNANQIWITEQFTKLAKESFIAVNMIGHLSKGGVYKGPSTILHEVDGQLKIYIDSESGERMFKFGKNRFGGVLDPYSFRIDSTGVFIGEEFWNTPGNDIMEITANAVKELRAASANVSVVPFEKFKETAQIVFKYLEHAHKDDLAKKSNVNGKIKLTYKGARAYCSPSKGLINLGPKFLNVCSDTKFRNLGYKKEQKYIRPRTNDKVDAALWIIIHEFQHLFNGNSDHTNAFFSRVANNWDRHAAVLTGK